jgi:hypothetical protein
MFNKASKKKAKLRLLLEGPSGSGKTYSALLLASALGKKIAVIDTEKCSASLYSSEFTFDVCELSPPYSPQKYIETIVFAEKSGYDVLIIDSISHEWSGDGGCLDIQQRLGGRYTDWVKVTPQHNKFLEAILQSRLHVIGTARTKSEYSITEEDGSKKQKIKKLGTKTEQRDGLEYEFTTVLRLNQGHFFESSKDRTHLFDGTNDIIRAEHAEMILKWLNDGEDAIEEIKQNPEINKRVQEIIGNMNKIEDLDNLQAAWKLGNQELLNLRYDGLELKVAYQKKYKELKATVAEIATAQEPIEAAPMDPKTGEWLKEFEGY